MVGTKPMLLLKNIRKTKNHLCVFLSLKWEREGGGGGGKSIKHSILGTFS
jgi:hypothetical protein